MKTRILTLLSLVGFIPLAYADDAAAAAAAHGGGMSSLIMFGGLFVMMYYLSHHKRNFVNYLGSSRHRIIGCFLE